MAFNKNLVAHYTHKRTGLTGFFVGGGFSLITFRAATGTARIEAKC